VRGRAGLRAAPAVAAVQPHLASAFRELENVAVMLDMQRGQEMHIAAPSDFVVLWLRPRLDRFLASYPNLRISVNGEGDAPLRIRPMDCEVGFGAATGPGAVDELFKDFVLPVCAPDIAARIAGLDRRSRLEGLPLLHLDFYKDDAAIPNWAGWIRAQKLLRTDPNRGIRYQRITTVVDAVLANAGLALCGLALLQPLLADGRLVRPFAAATGTWTNQAFRARFRAEALTRPHVRRFREWLGEEAAQTRDWLQQQPRRRRS
jgi:LysR family glycine cleavage system transcriptional activator